VHFSARRLLLCCLAVLCRKLQGKLTRDTQQDYLENQAIEVPLVSFVLRLFLHNWVDDPNIKILKKLCAAARPAACLLVVPRGLPPPSSPPLGNLGTAIVALLTMLDLKVR
jgi:hypothetical protein